MSMVDQNWWFTTLVIGKPILFSLTNGWAKFYQVDSHRKTTEMEGEF